MSPTSPSVGELLRAWRTRRRQSQLELAGAARISQRHLSFLESGRSLPSREMVLRLAKHLEVPARERNDLLTAAGFAEIYRERPLSDPALRAVRAAVELVLTAHEPFPALAIDRHWLLLSANGAAQRLLDGIAPALLAPPLNVLRISLHPEGLAPRIENLAAWREHVLARLSQQIERTGDTTLRALRAELAAFPGAASSARPPRDDGALVGIAVPLRLRTERGVLSLLSTTTIFGTPLDIAVSELAIETFLPADPETAEMLRQRAKD
jgi:transcriptional regulator with XRE-family HTH domain